jgi:malonate transporter and related proteins
MGFSIVLLAVAPIFMMIILGYMLKKSGFLPLTVWGPIEKLAIYVLYPGFLVPAIWHADLSAASAGAVSLAVLIGFVISALLALSLKPVLNLETATYTSVFQGLTRFNAFVIIPLVSAVYGKEVMGLAAVALSFMIPLSNFSSITVLARWGQPEGGRTHDGSALSILKIVIKNPIFAACILGLMLNFLKVPPLLVIDPFLKALGEAAIPTGLILAGAGLSFGYVATRPLLVGAVSIYKVLIMPFICWGLCVTFGGDQTAQGLSMAIGAAPSAAAGYVLARHMGGDAPFVAGVVAATTVLSAIALPLLLGLLHSLS